ncbi:hypothetical protein ABEB36_002731 [Hypothenemus hampei]|uniref:Uncharacterized protein n=1 Tax=Hypothenemus hampei TaxID=57062 RepID=A0ABD1F6T8_HYPHA
MEYLDDKVAKEALSNTNPYVKAGFLNRLFFIWPFPLFYKGYKYGFTENDIFTHLSSHDTTLLSERLEYEWNNEVKRKNQNASLWKVIFKIFGFQMLFYGSGYFVFEMLRLSQPLILAKYLEYFEPNSTISNNQAYIYAGALTCTTFVETVIIHHAVFHILHLGMRLKAAAIAMMYRKAMRLSKLALADTTIGKMINLISNDVSRFNSCVFLNDLWLAPILLVVYTYLLYIYAGWTGMVGLLLLLCSIPLQGWMGKKTSEYRLKTALKTDERIRIMNEIINGMQVIKMYTWERPFTKLVEAIRKAEMKVIRKKSVLKAIDMAIEALLTKSLIYTCITVYVLTGNSLSAQYVFGLSLLYESLRTSISGAFSNGITQMAEIITSSRRIKEFLLKDERETFIQKVTGPINISLENVSSKWQKSSEDCFLQNITFNAKPGKLTAIIGKVGSGKSTLLNVILKELPLASGQINVNGIISFASQEPWLFMSSIRQNILFGQEYDPEKYNNVIEVCALKRDLQLLLNGDKTIIGERGITLSGGQKARINLARAIYKNADIYLLDDPLSAVDVHVGKKIFRECIQKYLKEKCVILVTHQLHLLKDCNNIYLLNDGRIENSGSYENIKNSGEQFKLLLESLKKNEDETNAGDTDARKRTISSNSENIENEDLDALTIEKEQIVKGKVTWTMYKTYFSAAGNVWKILFLTFIFIISQVFANGTDYFLSVWVNFKAQSNVSGSNFTENSQELSYINKFWFSVLSDTLCLQIYTGLLAVVIVLMTFRGILFYLSCIKASTTLHNNMFSKIINAPMRFFTVNPSGRILNRFSNDMNQVDEYLPTVFSDTLLLGLLMAANVVVVSTVIPYILVPTCFILIIFYLFRSVFIVTSRDIKRIEALKRSPIYSQFTSSLHGLTTIRAFQSENYVINQFDSRQNSYNSTYFMYLACNRTFAFWLDQCSFLFTTLVIFSFLVIQNDYFGGSVGLAITQALSLDGYFQWGIRQWCELENSMTAVERLKEYANVEQEEDLNVSKSQNWPSNGAIQFKNVNLRYAQTEPYVLKNINFKIESKQKIGIVGRTGAGKSSIIAALFRLAEIDGAIIIDNLDTKCIALKTLRSSISIIPQEPVLFSGSLRKNLDPFNEFNDTVLWTALEEVEMKAIVTDLAHGLESPIMEGGANFSVGQRQLICLARALIRNNKILVMDEATANVDPHTDGLIQKTIKNKFANCTVLTIAHRLHTIMDSDKILVMDAGEVVEFDQPLTLLQNHNGKFFSMVQQTGPAMAKDLLAFATSTTSVS